MEVHEMPAKYSRKSVYWPPRNGWVIQKRFTLASGQFIYKFHQGPVEFRTVENTSLHTFKYDLVVCINSLFYKCFANELKLQLSPLPTDLMTKRINVVMGFRLYLGKVKLCVTTREQFASKYWITFDAIELCSTYVHVWSLNFGELVWIIVLFSQFLSKNHIFEV